MNIGSLYHAKKLVWLLFPTKGSAGVARPLPFQYAYLASDFAVWYSREHNCNVTYFSPDSFVVCLEEDGRKKKFLTSEGLIGWIWLGESYNECFEEVKAE